MPVRAYEGAWQSLAFHPLSKSSKSARPKPKAGDQIQLTATVTKVRDDDNPHLSKVTIRIPGYGIPITLSEATLAGDDG